MMTDEDLFRWVKAWTGVYGASRVTVREPLQGARAVSCHVLALIE